MYLLDLFSRKPPSASKRLGPADDGGGERNQAKLSPNSASTSTLPPYIQLYMPRLNPKSQTHGSATRGANVAELQQAQTAYMVEEESGARAPTTSPALETRDAVAAVTSGGIPSPDVHSAPPVPAAPTAETPAVAPPDGSAAPLESTVGPITQPASSDSASSSSSLGLKDCRSRACAGVVDTFHRALRKDAASARAPTATAPAPFSPASAASWESGDTSHAASGPSAPAADQQTAAPAAAAAGDGADGAADSVGAGGSERCPPDTWQLGRATWTFLHSVAAHYPDHPTERQQQLMRGLMEGLAEFYPCQVCAEHLREQVRDNPPQVATARDLNLWLCGIHNEVNEMLGKPLFDCSRILERWRDGPEDGSCD